MKQVIGILTVILSLTHLSLANHHEDEHLLDGTSMNYFYQNGAGVKAKFEAGQFHFEWIEGPMKGITGREAYRSRKIGDKLYLINFTVQANGTFVTLIFNFNQNVMYSSVLFAPGTDDEQTLFEGGIIEHLKLKEK